MAQNGGSPVAFPAVGIASHSPTVRAPVRELITLAQPRPGLNRQLNEYIDTPLRPNASGKTNKCRPKEDTSPSLPRPALVLPGVHRSSSRSVRSLLNAQVGLAITSQPSTGIAFKKDKVSDTLNASGREVGVSEQDDGHGDSIICRHCGRCKCEACANPRPLPSRWICKNKFLFSAHSMVDCCSCLCFVKGIFYHLTKDYELDDDVPCSDQPCSCSPHKRCLRWGCLGLLSAVMPCLCCYWPLKGCVKLCELCYSECTHHGCRCRRTILQTEQAPEKRLLDSNSDC